MNEIILATSNAGKIAELKAILSPLTCISQSSLDIESAEETGLSFIENALIKARHASRLSGKPALADDSGLVVAALGGEPGIYSARYAGSGASDNDNIKHLLTRLEPFPGNQRSAYFYCAIALVRHAEDPVPLIACGQLDGIISTELAGEYGFGYDPVFYIPAQGCTAAQLPAKTKNAISHRANALKQLQQQLVQL
ncbi:RdgB/HAM1 family non-canonical purine NTP pyrophosphatase [Legionella dresdenensis]|uniref:dITP/XTP pyrophosphatase n=1 Tax=Legionella dresdenensis TaxID=450200 RepID=A0ABV8CFJ2_9GAMM